MPMGIGLGIGVARGGGVGWWPAGSELALEFDNQRGFNSIDRTKTTPNSILTYTNPSAKLVYGSDGVLRYANHNLLLYSSEFDRPNWAKLAGGTATAPSVTANQGVAPDGTTTADRVQFALNGGVTSSDLSRLFQDVADPTVGLGTYSVYVRSFDGVSSYSMRIWSGFAEANITVTGAWQRFEIASSSVTLNAQIGLRGDHTSQSADVLVWGAQCQYGSTAGTYLPTTTAAVYSLPIDHNPTTFAPLGVLIEEQRTNLVTYSQAADNAAWSKVALLTVNGNNAGAPDGTATFCNLTPNTTNTQHYISTAAFTPAAGALCCSAYFKANGYRWVRFAHSTGIISFDTLTGTIGATSGITSSGVQSLGNGVYRAWFVYTASAVSASLFISVNNADNTGTTSFAGDGTSGVFVWGVQAEAGAFPTSYIPTVASQVTRAADQVSILTSAFAYNAAESTLLQEALVPNNNGVLSNLLSTTANILYTYRLNSTSLYLYGLTGGAFMVGIAAGGAPAASFNKVAWAAKLNDFAIVSNGGAVSSDTLGAMPAAATTLQIGGYDAASNNKLNGHIKRLTYFPTRKSNAELQVLST